jgi:periplasmic divalent cation tolerance protein
MDVKLIYMTAGSMDEARRIGRHLVEFRLAACVNLFEKMNSMYIWDGQLQDDQETVIIAKTTADRVPQLIQKVKDLHSYDCPCIVCLPVEDGNPAFLDWIAGQVTPTGA